MQKGKLTKRTLAVGLLASFFSIGSAYAQTGSASGSSTSKPEAAKSSPSPSSPASDAATKAQPSSGASSAGTTAAGTTPAATAMRKADQKMMNDLAQANLAEIKAGEMALQKSQNPQVKEFAQKMVDDHGAAMKELQTLAQSKGVTLPTEMDTKHKAMTTAMEKLSPERFDKTYISQGGVSDHKKTSKLVRDIQTKAKDSDLKAMAAKLQPAIDSHLKMAQDTKTKTDSKSSSSGASGAAGSGGASGAAGSSGASGAAGSGGGGAGGSSGSSGSSSTK